MPWTDIQPAIIFGDAFTFGFIVSTPENQPYNLTGSSIVCTITDGIRTITKTWLSGGIVVADPVSGAGYVHGVPGDWTGWPAVAAKLTWIVRVEPPSGDAFTPADGSLTVRIAGSLPPAPTPIAAYATRADLLAVLRIDSQAKLTTDPTRRWVVGSGDGATARFLTPFAEAGSMKGYVNGVEATSSLSRATGAGGRDEVLFAVVPVYGAVLAVTVDAGAINADVVDQALIHASDAIGGYFPTGVPDGLLARVRRIVAVRAAVLLRGGRNLDLSDPLAMEWKADTAFLEKVAEGKIPVAGSGDSGSFVGGSDTPVFGGGSWL